MEATHILSEERSPQALLITLLFSFAQHPDRGINAPCLPAAPGHRKGKRPRAAADIKIRGHRNAKSTDRSEKPGKNDCRKVPSISVLPPVIHMGKDFISR